MKKEEEVKKIEQVKKIFGSWYDFTGSDSSIVMLDSENAFVCVDGEVFFCNIPTADEFKLGEIQTGKDLGYEDSCGYDVDPENLGYYFVPTWNENGEPDQYPSASVADEIEFLNDCYSDVAVDGYDNAWKAFQKEVAELKKEQQQKQEEE